MKLIALSGIIPVYELSAYMNNIILHVYVIKPQTS